MRTQVLGVFCPFWSMEGPHLILPHFKGLLHALGAAGEILDLNVECAAKLAAEWPSLVENEDGLWSDPQRIAEIIERAGLRDSLVIAVTSYEPVWVAFLSVNIASYWVVRLLMQMLRQNQQGCLTKIAVGGPLCFGLADSRQAFPEADFVSEGTLESGLRIMGVMSGDNSCIVSPGSRTPLDFTGIDWGRFSRLERLPYVLNYGCRYSCRFCQEGMQYQREVSRSTTGLGRELRKYVDSLQSIRYIRFFDSSLNSDHKQFLGILDELTGTDLLWGCYLAPTPKIDEKVAARMAAAGCLGVNIGVESGSSDVRRLMRKPYPDIGGVEDCIRALHASGLAISINLIVGYPGETERDFEDTLRFVDRMRPFLSDVAAGKAGIYAGTPLFGEISSLGIDLGGDWDHEYVFNHWRLKDGPNTPEIRAERLERLNDHLTASGLTNARLPSARDPGLQALFGRGKGF